MICFHTTKAESSSRLLMRKRDLLFSYVFSTHAGVFPEPRAVRTDILLLPFSLFFSEHAGYTCTTQAKKGADTTRTQAAH